tara:strand:- start:1529 stop:2452 length:924 start_codon:yes stop_codon:yes gene_type:complete
MGLTKKYIVTTTINSPTLATRKFCEFKDWTLVVVGDTKTPHDEYKNLNCIYLSPSEQESLNKNLSDSIGWRSIQRRNLGFLFAYQEGADIVATVDDDNIPYDDWGKDLYVGQNIECDLYHSDNGIFDPLSITKRNEIWHRGYPIQHVPTRHQVEYKGKTNRKVLIQADLWDGDPDIDAMARLSLKPIVKYSDITKPYCSNQISPFNSQNTFLSREVIPFYTVLPHVGRMDDIWGGYILQSFFPNSIVYNRASVYQDRNVQDLITNLEKEIIGYRNTLNLINDLDNYMNYLPEKTKHFFNTYRNSFIL